MQPAQKTNVIAGKRMGSKKKDVAAEGEKQLTVNLARDKN